MVKSKSFKVAFYVGDLPTTTFINRLAIGLVGSGLQVTMFGLIKEHFNPPAGVFTSGARDGFKEGRISRFFRFLKFSILLSFFGKSDKKKLDSWLIENKKTHWNEKSMLYPIVWLKPDILHLQWVKDISHFGWTKALGMRLVVSLRGAHINYSPITEAGLADTYRKYFPNVDAFHGVSNAICKEAAKYNANLTKCTVVYSGFNIEEFSSSDWRNNFKILSQRPINIISVGRSHWKKGYHFALDAMRLLKAKNAHFHYTIIGAAGVEELEFQRDQLELADQVTFLDKVPFHEVKNMIRKADVLLLPSVEEGVANVVLEAMFLGTLVISTNCGGMEEVVTNEDNGIIVPIRNPKKIAEAIVRVYSESPDKLNKMVERAYEKVAKQHSEERMVLEMKKLYKN
jgi:colanic acid/amylovoran biosynthesis glycosyltransferase